MSTTVRGYRRAAILELMQGQDHEGPGPTHAKSSRDAQDAFRAVVPDDARVTVRPMFGSVAAFANDQMFMCLFADELYYRLGEDDRTGLKARSEEHTSELQSRLHLVCRLLLEKKKAQ